MRIGRGSGRRSLQTPSNTGLAARSERRLAATADAYAQRVETALAVDGVSFVIWNKGQGRYKCACTNGIWANKMMVAKQVDGRKPTAVSSGTSTKRRKFVQVDELTTNDSGNDDIFNSTPRDKILKQDINDTNRLGLDFGKQTVSQDIDSDDDPLLSAAEALDNDDSLLSEEIISCPLCFGTGKVDAWQPDNGLRILMDLSSRYTTDLARVSTSDPDNAVPKFTLDDKRSVISWTVPLPVAWLMLIRAALYDEDEIIPRGKYTMNIKLPNNTVVPFSMEQLRKLKYNLPASNEVTFILQGVDTPLRATHFELIYLFARPSRGQMPEIEIPYEDEIVDWNLNVNIELSPKAKLKEGSYVVDGKYKRTWKVDSYSQKRLSGGTVYGHTASLRALQPFEKLYTMFNVYTK